MFKAQSRVEKLWKESVGFHGKPCGLLALGVRVCDTALSRLGLDSAEPDRLVCVSEHDGCCVDAIQIGLHCTIGKRHLLFYKTGMLVFTVYDLTGGNSVRMRTRQEIADHIHELPPSDVLSMPEAQLFQFEEARPMTAKVWNKVTQACDAPGEQVPPRPSGLQDWPDTFRQFDEAK